jgi:hypothetical protein
MREIDCTNLPDELAKTALDTAEKTIERVPEDSSGVKILRNSKLVTINGDGKQMLRLYGALQQAMVSAVQEKLAEDYTEYTDEEYEKYRHGIEYRKV